MTKKKSTPKKTGAKKVTVKKVSNEIFSTKVNFCILTLFCLLIGTLFVSLY